MPAAKCIHKRAPETWKPVPGWPHEASTHGRIRSTDRRGPDGCWRLGALLSSYRDNRKGKGYDYVTLTDGPRRRNAAVHVLVLEAHRGARPGPGYEGCHGNGVRTDNCRDNLYWGTRIQNRADRERHRHVTKQAFPQDGTLARPSRHRVTGDAPPGTGSPPPLQSFPSPATSVQPLTTTPRTSLRSLCAWRAA